MFTVQILWWILQIIFNLDGTLFTSLNFLNDMNYRLFPWHFRAISHSLFLVSRSFPPCPLVVPSESFQSKLISMLHAKAHGVTWVTAGEKQHPPSNTPGKDISLSDVRKATGSFIAAGIIQTVGSHKALWWFNEKVNVVLSQSYGVDCSACDRQTELFI